MACAESLTVSFAPACTALKKPGGFQNFGFIGATSDLSGVTYDSGSGAIEAFTFAATKVLTKFTTKEFVVTAPSPVVDEGEGNVALITHTVNIPIYWDTQAELDALQTLLDADRLFVVLPTINKQLRVYGISSVTWPFQSFGLKVSGGEDSPGQNLNDPARMNLTLTGNMPNIPQLFLDTNYDTSLGLLEGYLTNP